MYRVSRRQQVFPNESAAMSRLTTGFLSILLVSTLAIQPLGAQIQVGATAPNFIKNDVLPPGVIGAPISLHDYTDKDAVVLFILGYG